MRTLASMLILFLAALVTITVMAATPVNLQTCSATLSPDAGLLGCPQPSVSFAPVSSTTLVRSIVANAQGFRAFNSLKSSDTVYAQDGQWHTLSSITPALQPTSILPPPVVVPPPPSLTQDVLITLVGGTAPQSVVFSGVNVPACFAIGSAPAKQVCLP